MDNSVILALIALATVFLTGTVTPITVGYFQYRIRKAERIIDSERHAIAAQLAYARDIKIDSLVTALAALKDTTDSTHGLVNSRMTVILQAMHDALVGQMEALRDNIELRRKNGNPPTQDAIVTLETLRHRIAEMQGLIADRAASEPGAPK